MSKFFAFISRMKFINRWALMRNTALESLTVHSHEVAVVAHALCVIGNRRFGKDYDPNFASTVALYHAASEIITGDMPTPIKYINSELLGAYKDIENQAIRSLLDLLPRDMQGDYEKILFFDEKYKKIIKASDKISALIKCEEELKMGNDEFKHAKKSTYKAIKDLSCEEADVFLDEFFPAYTLTLDELK